MECTIQKVDKDYRIFLPLAVLRRAKWIAGEVPLEAWLVMGSAGRCRLLSSAEFEGDASCRALRDAMKTLSDRPIGGAAEFDDEDSAMLGLRLLSVEITPPGPGWRLALPRALAAVMGVQPKESSVAVLFLRDRIEIWTLEALRAAVATPLSELI